LSARPGSADLQIGSECLSDQQAQPDASLRPKCEPNAADLEIGVPRRGFYHKLAGVHFQRREPRRV
jgi:hypothetical protein